MTQQQEVAKKRELTEDEEKCLYHLREKLWSDFYDDDKTALKPGQVLSLEEWAWLKDLVSVTTVKAEVAQGLTTPNPFALCFDNGSKLVMMLHPTQLPEELREQDALELFRAVEVQSS